MAVKKRGLERPNTLSKVEDVKKKMKKSKRKSDDEGILTPIPNFTGLGSKSTLNNAEGEDMRQGKASHIIQQNEEDETGDEDEASSADDENDFESGSQANVDETTTTSSFHRHMGHILTDEDADKLMKSKLKYKWEMPATGKLISKWVGTGEPLSTEVSSDLVYGVKQKLYNHWLDIYKANSFAELNPQVLFLLPLGSIALRVVKRLIQLIPASHKAHVEYIDRFSKEFGVGDSEEDDEDSRTRKRAKPKDFQRLFGGNNNDHFVIGIKLTKRSIKLYNDFYSSDVIVASPLGLITKIGEVEAEKGKDVDYLSSIEVLIIDHADVIAMQNWSHLNTVVEQLNRTPSKQHGTDVMRIRQWYLDGHARFYRQTILLGSHPNPDMNALFNGSCMNYEGKIKLTSECKGVLPEVLLQVRQVYERFDASSIVDVDEARLDYFCNKVFPKLKDSVEGGIMLFISSYFEYVRVRNFLSSQNASVCLFGDYAEPSDISCARGWFFKGERKIMLYTERAHFYHRYKIRGLKNLLIYSLPERREFYPEIINMLEEENNMTCSVLFSRFDLLRLERIVGTTAAKRMVSSDKIFVFC